MSETHPIPALESIPDAIPDRTARRLQKLDHLSNIGIDLAELIQAQMHQAAAQAAPPTVIAQLNMSYQRLARSIRQTVALEAKLEEEYRTRGVRDAQAGARKIASSARHTRLARRDQVRKMVEDSIEADKGLEDKEDLLFDLHRFFEDTEIDFADATRAIGQIAMEICEQLGILPDIKNWDDETMGFVYPPTPQLRANPPDDQPDEITPHPSDHPPDP